MRVAVIGATGVVGETILRVLEERNVPVDALLGVRVARARRTRSFQGRVAAGRGGDDASASSPTGRTSRSSPRATMPAPRWRKALADAGIVVIDNSSTFRLDPELPARDPGGQPAVDPARAPDFPGRQLHGDRAVRRRSRRSSARSACAAVRVATYQAVSGAGRAGLDDAGRRGSAATQPNGTFAAPILHNVVPQIGSVHRRRRQRRRGEGRRRDAQDAQPSRPARRRDVRARAGAPRAQRSGVLRDRTPDERRRARRRARSGAAASSIHDRGIVTPLDVEDTDVVHVARLRAGEPLETTTRAS